MKMKKIGAGGGGMSEIYLCGSDTASVSFGTGQFTVENRNPEGFFG